MANTHGARLAIVRYHVWWPDDSDPYYRYNTSEVTIRKNYYGPQYTPYMYVDGNIDAGYNYGTWGGRISNELNVASPLDIQIDGDFDQTSRTGQLFIKVIATDSIVNTNLKLRVVVTESNINWLGPNGTRWHHQTFRDLVPNPAGISFSIVEGDTAEFTQSFSCPSPLVIRNCEVVVFVQSDSGHRILQGAKRGVNTMLYNLAPFSLILPPSQDTIETCYPECVWHASADPDSGFPVSYQVQISNTTDFQSPILVSDTLADSTWSCPVCLQSDSLYYWRVVAFNGHAPVRASNEIFSFVVEEPPGSCVYIPGDINNNGQANGVDVSYGVNYFKGFGEEPPVLCPDCPEAGQGLFGAGDVNGNCQFNGVDISYFVNYLKGIGPEPIYCQNCPPAR